MLAVGAYFLSDALPMNGVAVSAANKLVFVDYSAYLINSSNESISDLI